MPRVVRRGAEQIEDECAAEQRKKFMGGGLMHEIWFSHSAFLEEGLSETFPIFWRLQKRYQW